MFGEDPANRRERLRSLLAAQLERGELLEAVEEATIAATAVRGPYPKDSFPFSNLHRLMKGCGFMKAQSNY